MSRFDRIEQIEIEKIAKKVAGGGGGGSGTVTQVNSGTGLTGGPITTTGTLSVSFGTSGTTACVGNDSRLTNDRNPTAHAASHAVAGSDPITLAQSQVTNLTTDLANKSNVGHTHPQSDVTNLTTDLAAKAPNTPSYLTLATDAGLTNERVATAGNHISLVDAGAGSTLTMDWDYNPGRLAIIESEFNATGNMLAQGSGTGASVAYTTTGIETADHIGIGRITTGTTATGRYALGSANATCVVLGTYRVLFTSWVRIQAVSDGTNTFILQSGLFDSLTGAPTDSLVFQYTHSVFGGNWECSVYNAGGSITSVDSGVACAVNTWYRLDIDVNAAANSTLFKINGTTVYTHTGTTPTGTARAMGFYTNIRKTLGTTARTAEVDYMGYRTWLTR
jgi:hypothetical protein